MSATTTPDIHPMSAIHPDAQIGTGTTVGAFTSIAADVVIGENTWIGPNVSIMDGARIGSNCRIFPGAVISAIPQDLKYDGEQTTAEIGDHTTIRECCTINRGTSDKWKTVVGNHSLLMAYTHIAHDAHIGNHCIIANSANIAGHVVVEDYVVIEGVVAIHLYGGKHSFLAGGSLVRKNVPPFVKAAREPLSFAGVNTIGLQTRIQQRNHRRPVPCHLRAQQQPKRSKPPTRNCLRRRKRLHAAIHPHERQGIIRGPF